MPSQVSRHCCGCRVWNSPEAPTLMTSPRRSSFGRSPEVMTSGGLGGGAGEVAAATGPAASQSAAADSTIARAMRAGAGIPL